MLVSGSKAFRQACNNFALHSAVQVLPAVDIVYICSRATACCHRNRLLCNIFPSSFDFPPKPSTADTADSACGVGEKELAGRDRGWNDVKPPSKCCHQMWYFAGTSIKASLVVPTSGPEAVSKAKLQG